MHFSNLIIASLASLAMASPLDKRYTTAPNSDWTLKDIVSFQSNKGSGQPSHFSFTFIDNRAKFPLTTKCKHQEAEGAAIGDQQHNCANNTVSYTVTKGNIAISRSYIDTS